MSSHLTVKSGIYDPTKRFAFTNDCKAFPVLNNEDFTFHWNGTPITVKANETVELPHHLAILATQYLVDRIMQREVAAEDKKARAEKNDPYLPSRRGLSMGVPEARRPYEEKVLKELPALKGTDSQFNIIRMQTQEQIAKDMRAEPAPPISALSQAGLTGMKEFEDVNLSNK